MRLIEVLGLEQSLEAQVRLKVLLVGLNINVLRFNVLHMGFQEGKDRDELVLLQEPLLLGAKLCRGYIRL